MTTTCFPNSKQFNTQHKNAIVCSTSLRQSMSNKFTPLWDQIFFFNQLPKQSISKTQQSSNYCFDQHANKAILTAIPLILINVLILVFFFFKKKISFSTFFEKWFRWGCVKNSGDTVRGGYSITFKSCQALFNLITWSLQRLYT